MRQIGGIFLIFSSLAQANALPNYAFPDAETVVVTGSRIGGLRKNIPQAITILNENDLASRGNNVAEVLRSVPGISVSGSGGEGHVKGVYIRGGESAQTLVLVDGIIVNDPLSPSRSFDFSQIPVAQIERIEILRGPQSVTYGSDAMAGVIQIFTKPENSKPWVALEGGSRNTWRSSLAAYGFYADYFSTAGISQADKRQGNPERDPHWDFKLGGKKRYVLGENTLLSMQGNYLQAKTGTDRTGGPGGDSINTFSRSDRVLFQSNIITQDTREIDWKYGASLAQTNREDNTSGNSFFRANLGKLSLEGKKKFTSHTLLVGAEAQNESGRSNDIPLLKTARVFSVFVENQFLRDRIQGSLGIRADKHTISGSNVTERFSFGYWLLSEEKLRLKSSLGTGFKAPSLYQLYSSYGSTDLRAEKNVGWDVGLDWKMHNSWSSEIFFFENRYRNLIDYDFTSSKYRNITRTNTKGVELSLLWQNAQWQLKQAFTSILARDGSTRLLLYRRPRMSYSFVLGRDFGSDKNIAIFGNYIGRREDVDSLSMRKNMPPYFVMGLSGATRLSRAFLGRARIENLLHRTYQENSGYGSPGFSMFVGIETIL